MFLQYRINGLISGSEPSTVVRCVEIGRLPVILRQGCDVEPKDAVMWIDKSSSRALEYGGEQKVLMIFDIRRTEPSYQQVPADTDQATLDELQKTYPTVERSIDGSMLWLSRLPENDKRVASPYESEHGRWISSDPFAALSGLLVLGRDMKAMKSFVESSIAACDHPTWE